MQKYGSLILVILLLLFSLACKKSMSPEKYIQWVNTESSGLVSKQGNEEFEVTVQYRPAQYMALMETGKDVTKEVYDNIVDRYDGSSYFAFKIKKLQGDGDILQSRGNGGAQYYERLKYFSEDIKNDVYVLAGEDTVPCMLNHLERTYKVSPYTNILFAFEIGKDKIKENKKLLFIYDDKALGIGKQTFEISTAPIEQVPIIKF